VEAQSQILTELNIDHIVLHGGYYDGPAHSERIELLDYSTKFDKDLYDECLKIATKSLGAPPTIWHIHNPTLGKNAAFPEMIHRMATSMTPLLLQTHDFAEDGRPSNYQILTDLTYPIAPQIEFATLNHRDAAMLHDVGIQHISILPPPVDTHPITKTPAPQPLLLYPVRGIRRKNLGEATLLAAASHYPIAVTLPPRNPEWIPYHDRWRNLAHELRLNIEFAVVDRISPSPHHKNSSYESWLKQCTHILTTSINEGFGLAFLEPITHQTPVIGRDLPQITQDFPKLHGDNLYQALLIPRPWLDAHAITETIQNQWIKNHLDYHYPLTAQHQDQLWEHLNRFPDHFDFGDLPEESQENIIRLIQTNPELSESILVLTTTTTMTFPHWLEKALNHTSPNVEAIKPWSLQAHSNTLLSIYSRLATSDPQLPQWLDNTTLLPHFLQPDRFCILHS